jgi:hypothetical protein
MHRMSLHDTEKIGRLMASEQSKAADEIFCRSCGEPIKEEAEICPHCGVRNERAGNSSSQGTSSNPVSTAHDPSKYDTTVSNTWWYGVAGGIFLWVIVLILTEISTGAFVGFLGLAAWIGLPAAAYFDMKYVRANGKWNPSTAIWIILLAIWLVNIVAGAVYLYRRHEVLGEP